MKPASDVALPRNVHVTSRTAGLVVGSWLLTATLVGGACADDLAPTVFDADGDLMDAGFDDPGDLAPDDLAVSFDLGPPPTEPVLTIPACPMDGDAGLACCASALGFEDGSTSHFLTPACCRLGLSKPQLVSTPTACGRGALRLDADFRATDANSLCGEPGEAAACALREGEVSRAVLAPLDLTGLTVSAMVFMDGPALPAAPVHANLFVLGRGGLIAGTSLPLVRTGVWTRLELQIADDGTAPGAEIRVIGVRMAFHGQPWLGRAFIDEITWH